MSGLTRDGAAEPVSRDQVLRSEQGQGNNHFPCPADHERDWQQYPVDQYWYSAICDDHTTPPSPTINGNVRLSPAVPKAPELAQMPLLLQMADPSQVRSCRRDPAEPEGEGEKIPRNLDASAVLLASRRTRAQGRAGRRRLWPYPENNPPWEELGMFRRSRAP